MTFVGFLILFGFSCVLFSCEGQVYPPSDVIAVISGSTVRLKWTFRANPSKASLAWFFTRRRVGSKEQKLAGKQRKNPLAKIKTSSLPGIAIELTPATLVLKNVDERYNGKYRFSVQASVGGGEAVVELYIAEKLTVTLSCSSLVKVNEGDNFTCVCRGEGGNPPADVTWFKDGVQIAGTGKEEQTLTLRNVSKTASGIYKCVAQSSTLTAEESVEIFFYYAVPPTVLSLTSTPENVLLGETVVIMCEAVAVHLPSYTIIHNDTETVSTHKTYIITVLKYSHAGLYKCIATNHLGNSSKIFSLSVAATRTTNSLTTMNFGSGENSGTEWYIVVVSLVSGIIIGIIFSYIVWCSRRRRFRNKKPEQYSDPKTSGVDTTYQELDFSKMNKEDNYQSLIVNAANNDDVNDDGINDDGNDDGNDDDSTYTKLSKTRDVENNYQSLT